MTPTKPTNLIQYPLAVGEKDLAIIRDADGVMVAACYGNTNKNLAAEIVRVMNAYHYWDVDAAAQPTSDKPATVAPGEPSEWAMQAAENWIGQWSDEPTISHRKMARFIDQAFAPKLAEMEREMENEISAAERERDEAKSELKSERDATIERIRNLLLSDPALRGNDTSLPA